MTHEQASGPHTLYGSERWIFHKVSSYHRTHDLTPCARPGCSSATFRFLFHQGFKVLLVNHEDFGARLSRHAFWGSCLLATWLRAFGPNRHSTPKGCWKSSAPGHSTAMPISTYDGVPRGHYQPGELALAPTATRTVNSCPRQRRLQIMHTAYDSFISCHSLTLMSHLRLGCVHVDTNPHKMVQALRIDSCRSSNIAEPFAKSLILQCHLSTNE